MQKIKSKKNQKASKCKKIKCKKVKKAKIKKDKNDKKFSYSLVDNAVFGYRA